jgi:hypothetical protein
MTTSVIARVDFENDAEYFWNEFLTRLDGLYQGSELAINCHALWQHNQVELLDANAVQEFDEFVHAIPGFSDGPKHAKDAILFQPAELSDSDVDALVAEHENEFERRAAEIAEAYEIDQEERYAAE